MRFLVTSFDSLTVDLLLDRVVIFSVKFIKLEKQQSYTAHTFRT